MSTRIAVTSDTHCVEHDGSDLPPAMIDALEGVDLIVHLGDVCAPGTLDRLEQIAPVEAIRSFADTSSDPRLEHDARSIEREGLRIGLINHLKQRRLGDDLGTRFGGRVDVVLFGGTHAEHVSVRDGVLFVNPGSPTLPAGDGPTLARLELGDGEVSVEIVRLPA